MAALADCEGVASEVVCSLTHSSTGFRELSVTNEKMTLEKCSALRGYNSSAMRGRSEQRAHTGARLRFSSTLRTDTHTAPMQNGHIVNQNTLSKDSRDVPQALREPPGCRRVVLISRVDYASQVFPRDALTLHQLPPPPPPPPAPATAVAAAADADDRHGAAACWRIPFAPKTCMCRAPRQRSH